MKLEIFVALGYQRKRLAEMAARAIDDLDSLDELVLSEGDGAQVSVWRESLLAEIEALYTRLGEFRAKVAQMPMFILGGRYGE
jgi:acetate kinase